MITVKVEVGDRDEHRVQREVRGVTLFTTVGMWVSGKFCWKIFLGGFDRNASFLSGESHGQRSLAGYSPRGHKESDSTERLSLSLSLLHTHTHPSKLELPVLTRKVDLLLMSTDLAVFLSQILFSRFVTGDSINSGSKINFRSIQSFSCV